MTTLVPIELIASKIYLIRGIKVMLDRDLAELYDVETRVLNQAVSRNIERFPEDFMFSLTREEIMRISQIVTSSEIKFSKSVRCFTEQGVAMLSSVLKSKRAIEVNIAIMRAFVKLREALLDNKDLRRELEGLKQITEERFRIVFETLDQLNRINQEFYQKFTESFDQTRRKIQPGVSTILENTARKGNWLDIGCGNGNLAHTWAQKGYTGLYFGYIEFF